jgi:hypothetical protein
MNVDVDFDELSGLGPRIEPQPEQDNTVKTNPFMPQIPQWQEPGWWETGAPYTDLGYLLEGGGALSPFIGARMASSKARQAREDRAAPDRWSRRIKDIERQQDALARGNVEEAAEAAREAEEARLRGDRNVAENRRHVTDAERAVENANAAVRAATDAESNAYAEETARRMREFDAANADIDARIARNNADVGSSALDYADDFVDNVYGQDLLPRIRTLRRDAQLGGTGTPAERTAQTAEIAESLVPEVREWVRNGRYDNLAALRHFDKPLWDEIIKTETAARAARANAGVTLERGAVPVEPYPGIGVSIEHHPDVEAFRNFRDRAKAFDDAVLSRVRETPDGRLSFDRGAPLSDAALDAIAEVDPIFAEQLGGLRRRSSDMTAALEGGRPDRPATANADNFRYDRRGDITRARRNQTRANAALETARENLARAEASAGERAATERGSGDTLLFGRRPTEANLKLEHGHAERMFEAAKELAARTPTDVASLSVPAAWLRGGIEGGLAGIGLGGLGALSQSFGRNRDLRNERDRTAFNAASIQSAEAAREARTAQRAADAIGHAFGGSSVLTK